MKALALIVLYLLSGRHDKWLKFNHFKGTILDVLNRLSESGLTDQSDPDVDVPNVYHGFQTAEGIRKEHPDNGWFQLTGLIHDIGKVGNMNRGISWSILHAGKTLKCTPLPPDHGTVR